MSIHEIRPDPPRSVPEPASRATESDRVAGVQPARRVEWTDRIEISQDARRLAEATASDGPDQAVDGLAPERVAEIRERIRSGFYDSPAVAERVARRMIEWGDIRAGGAPAGVDERL